MPCVAHKPTAQAQSAHSFTHQRGVCALLTTTHSTSELEEQRVFVFCVRALGFGWDFWIVETERAAPPHIIIYVFHFE